MYLSSWRPMVDREVGSGYYSDATRQRTNDLLSVAMLQAAYNLAERLASRGQEPPSQREQTIMLFEMAAGIIRDLQQHPDRIWQTQPEIPHSLTYPEPYRHALSILGDATWERRISQAIQGVADGAVARIPPGTPRAERRRIEDAISLAVTEGATRAAARIRLDQRGDYGNVHALSMRIAEEASGALADIRSSVEAGAVDPLESFRNRFDEFPDPVQFRNAYYVGELCLGMVQSSEEGFLIRRGTLEGNLLAGQNQVERWLYAFAAGHVRDPQAQLDSITLVGDAMREAREGLIPAFRRNIEDGTSAIPTVNDSAWFIVEQARGILEERRDHLRESPGGRRVRVTAEDFQQALNLLNRAVSEAAPFGRARPSLRE